LVHREPDDGVIGSFFKNDREEVRVSVSKFKGHLLVDIRVYSPSYREPGKMVPTKKGISIRAEMLPAFLGVLEKAHDSLVEQKKLPQPPL